MVRVCPPLEVRQAASWRLLLSSSRWARFHGSIQGLDLDKVVLRGPGLYFISRFEVLHRTLAVSQLLHRVLVEIEVAARVALRLGEFRHGNVALLSPLVRLDLGIGVLVQLPHQQSDLAVAIVNEEALIEQRILLAVVELQAPLGLPVEYRLASLSDQGLAPYREVFLQVVVQSDAVVGVLEQLQFVLQVLQLQLLLRSQERLVVCLEHLDSLDFLLVTANVLLGYSRPALQLLEEVGVVL